MATLQSMSDKHALIVGVGPGMGQALALVYARAGYDLTLVARREASLTPVVAQVQAAGRLAWPVVADASDAEQIDAAVTRASENGPISLLHHNASAHPGSLLQTDPQSITEALSTSFTAAVVAVQAALPDLAATSGTVAWTGGGIALNPRAEFGVLAAGKAALRAAGLALAPELAEHGVRLRMLTVNGFIRPGGRFDPDRIAAAFMAHLQDPVGQVELIYDGKG